MTAATNTKSGEDFIPLASPDAGPALSPPGGGSGTPERPWVEVYLARIAAARAWLDARWLKVSRVNRDEPIAAWRVTGYAGTFTNEQLVALAETYGFKGGACG